MAPIGPSPKRLEREDRMAVGVPADRPISWKRAGAGFLGTRIDAEAFPDRYCKRVLFSFFNTRSLSSVPSLSPSQLVHVPVLVLREASSSSSRLRLGDDLAAILERVRDRLSLGVQKLYSHPHRRSYCLGLEKDELILLNRTN